MVYGFMDENAGAGLGLNSQQQQRPRDLFRDVLGSGGLQDYFRVSGLSNNNQSIPNPPPLALLAYAHEQQQQQRLALRPQQNEGELFAFHSSAANAIGKRFVEKREEYSESTDRHYHREASSSENTVRSPSREYHHYQLHPSPLNVISRHQNRQQATSTTSIELDEQSKQQEQQQSGSIACKECGNQAKKDCPYQRCRTCCKSRAFDCETHVKSTWVPASKRRERNVHQCSYGGEAMIMDADARPKRARSSSQLLGASSSGESPRSDAAGNFPTEVRTHALFKCVKLTTADDFEDEYAYQATVKIAGRIFKGVLHDKGVIEPDSSNEVNTNSAANSRMSSAHFGALGMLIDPAVALDSGQAWRL